MRKLLIALALVPALSHAALLIEDGDMDMSAQVRAPVSSSAVAVPVVSIPAQKAPLIKVAAAEPTWVASPAAGNFRQLLEAWAKRENNDFLWDVDKDVPVDGNDTFTGTFKSAVRHVLRSTELTGYPLKPCFYANQPRPLVRVVKKTVACDPTN